MSKPRGAVRSRVCRLMVLAGAASAVMAGSSLAGDEWKAAENPLMTRWGKQVKADKVWPEYPRPQMVREEWQNLNGLWDFALTKRDDAMPGAFEKKILVPFCPDSALSGLRIKVEADDRMWYRREFSVPESWKGKRVLVNFGGVDWDTVVTVNGKEVGKHRGSYLAFSFDITDALKGEGRQELVVSVWNPCGSVGEPRGKQAHPAFTPPRGIMYTRSSGIWQTVWLEAVPRTHIRDLKITPDVDGSCVRLVVKTGGEAGGAKVTAELRDGSDTVVKADGKAGEEMVLKIAKPKLWTPDAPNLHGLKVTMKSGDGEDAVGSYCAMRKIAIGKDEDGITRILLNGKFVMQVGPLDQGFWPDGLHTPPSDDALMFDIDAMKKYGFNMVRKHVKVEPDRWYYHCDTLGLMVWQDMPSSGNNTPEAKQQFEAELEEMIAGLYNHPSIIMWIPFNEGWGQYDTPRITETVKKLDPSRLVNNASGWHDQKVGDIVDRHSYPGPGKSHPEETRAAVIGEFGGLGYNVPGNRWHESGWGYATYDGFEALNAAYVELYKALFQRVKDPGVSGAVYTQLTDIEAENNGLMSYDREIFKINPAYASIHKGIMPRGFMNPQFVNMPDLFFDEMSITLGDPPKDAKVHFTLDGEEPSATSPEYKAPIVIKADTTVKIIAAWDDGTKSPAQSKTFKKADADTLMKAVTLPATVEPGVEASYFELENGPSKLPDFAVLKPVRTFKLDTFTIDFERRAANFGVVFQGYITVPAKGAYMFCCDSDDGARLLIGDKVVVENDGVHGMKEVCGYVALEAGSHPIKVQYFQGGGGLGLRVRYQGSGIGKADIPKNALSFAAKK